MVGGVGGNLCTQFFFGERLVRQHVKDLWWPADGNDHEHKKKKTNKENSSAWHFTASGQVSSRDWIAYSRTRSKRPRRSAGSFARQGSPQSFLPGPGRRAKLALIGGEENDARGGKKTCYENACLRAFGRIGEKMLRSLRSHEQQIIYTPAHTESTPKTIQVAPRVENQPLHPCETIPKSISERMGTRRSRAIDRSVGRA